MSDYIRICCTRCGSTDYEVSERKLIREDDSVHRYKSECMCRKCGCYFQTPEQIRRERLGNLRYLVGVILFFWLGLTNYDRMDFFISGGMLLFMVGRHVFLSGKLTEIETAMRSFAEREGGTV